MVFSSIIESCLLIDHSYIDYLFFGVFLFFVTLPTLICLITLIIAFIKNPFIGFSLIILSSILISIINFFY